jgi:hypothetical protein
VKDPDAGNDLAGVAVQAKDFASRFQFSMYDLIVLMSTRREVNVRA